MSQIATVLSGSTSGAPIAVAAVASPGTLLHTAVAGLNLVDEMYVFATNRSGAFVSLTVEFGGLTAADHATEDHVLPPNSAPIPILVGQRINGGLEIRAFASVASAVNVTGAVNRISA